MKTSALSMAAVVLLVAGAARGFPMVRPNCPVLGNWTDPEGTKHMWLSLVPHPEGGLVTEEMSLNTSRTIIHHVLTRAANDSVLSTTTTPLVYFPSNLTRPDGHEERESVVVQAKCVNDLLWVSVIPVSEESIYGHVMSFTLRRQVLPVLSEAPPPLPPTTPHPHLPPGTQSSSKTPQFILVNVTFPQRQEDDNISYMEDLLEQEHKEDSDASSKSSDKNSLRDPPSSSGQDEPLES